MPPSTVRTGRLVVRAALVVPLLLVMTTSARAHLMAGQRGTLNLVGSGAFMVLSVPVSTFEGVDDDGDGRLSTLEFERHHDALAAIVVRRTRLLDEHGQRPLGSLMLVPSTPDDEPTGGAAHLVVLGRFALSGTDGPLRLDIDLFGTDEAERTLPVTVTRKATGQRRTLVLTPESKAQRLFP